MTLLIVGHRGAMAHAPENSLQSYALAEEVGVDEIELDVRLSKDGELFLLHDATLDRTAGDDAARGLGPAAELTLTQLQAVVLNSGRGVVTLAEMYAATTTFIQLEIKDPATVPALARYFAAHPADAGRTILTSFHPDALRHAAELMPTIGRCIIVQALADAERFEGGWRGLLDHTRATRFACGFQDLTQDVVDALHDLGVEVHVWPCRTVDDVRRAVELGADGTTSDDPAQAMSWLQQVLGERTAAS
ncbi:glycerophosphodiester phosphodiesterase [Auraticoccus sp. F435]|uniref:Glycerophosphodiester phosphodiesterase n=1 Tax=Auraticoccus cholistanensis TaxID=2656650 RepID=A0A6A9V098_9ACTN|nr:glycerophosphodiester phosphodiesterase family protein [Auraticoccus cholistanensis]MVA75040.1 glycerophosphodiester phosphodiesterase [Auraticoccus cholistanensis]